MTTTTDQTDDPAARARTPKGIRAGAQAGLDVLLTDAVVGRGTRRFIQPRAVAAVGAGVTRHPLSVARRVSGLGTQLARVAGRRWRSRASVAGRRLPASDRPRSCSTADAT